VPEDVALVGYDNWEIIAAATRPPLTTMDMNLRERGAQAGGLLVGFMGGQKGGERILVAPRLAIRDSSGATRAMGPRTSNSRKELK
jgi:LacI family transcriptional regulator